MLTCCKCGMPSEIRMCKSCKSELNKKYYQNRKSSGKTSSVKQKRNKFNCLICKYAPTNEFPMDLDYSPDGSVRGVLCGLCKDALIKLRHFDTDMFNGVKRYLKMYPDGPVEYSDVQEQIKTNRTETTSRSEYEETGEDILYPNGRV